MSETITPELFAHLVDLAALELSPEEGEYIRAQLNNQLKAIHELEAIPLDEDLPIDFARRALHGRHQPGPARRCLAGLPQPGGNPRPGPAVRRRLHHRPRHSPHQAGVDPWNFAIFRPRTGRLLRQRQASAVEILESTLERIGQVDGRPGTLEPGPLTEEDRHKVHAFITLTDERARAQARSGGPQAGGGRGPRPAGRRSLHRQGHLLRARHALHGRPRASWPISSRPTPPRRWSAWRQPAAVMLGKVNLDEFTYGSSNESSAFQPSPRNPWDPAACRAAPRAAAPRRWQPAKAALSPGHRYRRLDPPAGRLLRRGGREAHLRARLALRADRLWLLAGLPRPAGAQRDRRGPDAAGHRRARPARQHRRQRAGAAITWPGWKRACAGCASASRRITSASPTPTPDGELRAAAPAR